MSDQPPPGNYPPPPPPGGGDYPPPPGGGGGYPPPPPPGGYPPPPPPGGYPPPPPPGGYPPPHGGAPGYPPPPQQGGYPPPGYPPPGGPGFGGAPAYSIGDAFSWAWNRFTNNAVPFLVATLVWGLVIVVLQWIINALGGAFNDGDTTSYATDDGGFAFSYSLNSPGAVIVSIIGWIVLLIVGATVQSAYVGGVLDIANGQPVSIGSFFRPRNIGNVVIAGLIVGILTSIGLFLCVIPGLIVAIFTMFTIVALLDRNLAPIDAIKTSFNVVKENFGAALLTWLVMLVIAIVGALLCGVGLLVAIPLVILIEVYAFRKLSGGQVAEHNPQQLPSQ
ncbi:hypothetical protein [Mycolicibacterium sp. XJ879]